MKKYYLYIFSLIFLASCTSEDDIHAELGELWYELEDGPEGSADHYAYDFKKECGVTILFNPELKDYRYNFEQVNNIEIVPCAQEEPVKQKGIDVLRKVFINHYPAAFRKSFFPYLLIPADTIVTRAIYDWDRPTFYPAFFASNFLAIDNINREKVRTEDELDALTNELNLKFWTEYIPKMHSGWQIPFDFASPDLQKYYESEPSLTEPTAEELELMKKTAFGKAAEAGVIPCYDRLYYDSYYTKKYYYRVYIDRVGPGWRDQVDYKERDLIQFFNVAFKNTPDQIETFLNGEGMEIVKKRYEILRKGIRDFFHYDLNDFNR